MRKLPESLPKLFAPGKTGYHVILLAFLILAACDGGSGWKVSDIVGSGTIDELSPAQYSIDARGDTGISYLWSVDPEVAGILDQPESENVTFTPVGVSADTTIKIMVTVNSDNHDPVIRTRQVTVVDTGENNLILGDIQGPVIFNERTSTTFSIEAFGDTGISYYWAVEPASAGSFVDNSREEVIFNAGETDGDLSAHVYVIVDSDNTGPEMKKHQVLICDTD